MKTLYYGDNLEVLRESIKDESIDLIYLDPPFNSKRDYNLLFKSPKGHDSDAQITAFADSWHWGKLGTLPIFLLPKNGEVSVRSNSWISYGFKSRLGSCPFTPVAQGSGVLVTRGRKFPIGKAAGRC